MNRLPANSLHHQRGVGLIEVLVAVLILSIGLLGMAWVQTRALSNNNSSMIRSMAVVASYSIMDALRTNRAAASDGDYNGTVTVDDCPSADGSLVSTHLSDWCNELAAALGTLSDDEDTTATGQINCDGTGACEITITFNDSRIGEGGEEAQTVITRGML